MEEDYDIRLERNPEVIKISIKLNVLKKLIFLFLIFLFFIFFLLSIYLKTIEFYINTFFYVFIGHILSFFFIGYLEE